MYKYHVTLLAGLVVFSLASAFAFTYLYGAFFQHDRYWNGTIRRVEATEIQLVHAIASLLDRNDAHAPARRFHILFGPLTGKLVVRVRQAGQLVYTNEISGRPLAPHSDHIATKSQDLMVEVQRYQAPSWNHNFARWFSHLRLWFTPAFDYITVPFLTSFVCSFFFLYALMWRFRERHLSLEVYQLLLRMGRDR